MQDQDIKGSTPRSIGIDDPTGRLFGVKTLNVLIQLGLAVVALISIKVRERGMIGLCIRCLRR